MNVKNIMAVGLLAAVTVGSTVANAQYAQPQWGTGVWGGQQPCPYPVQTANGAQNYLDEYREVKNQLDKERERLDFMEGRQRKINNIIEDAQDDINAVVDVKYADFLIAHITNQNTCSEYQRSGSGERPAPQPSAVVPPAEKELPLPPPSDVSVEPEGKTKAQMAREKREAAKRNRDGSKARKTQPKDVGDNTEVASSSRAPASADESGGANDSLLPITGFTERQWADVCLRNKKGGISPIVCSRAPYKAIRKGKGSESDCREALNTLREESNALQDLESEISNAKRKISRLEKELDRSETSAVRRSKTISTEAGYCAICEQYAAQARQRAQIASAVVGVGGLVLMAKERRDYNDTNRYIADRNSDLGWATPTAPSPGVGAGAMLVGAGLAGYIASSTGSGSYGCAAGLNGTGNINGPAGIAGPYGQGPGPYPVYGQPNNPFGYPQNIIGQPQGGAMYIPGQGAWGPNGPFALNGTNGPILAAPGNPYMYGQNGSIPYGAVIGRDAYGNPVYSQGGVPGAFGQNGVYNPYGNQFGIPGAPGAPGANGQFVNGQFVGAGQFGNSQYGQFGAVPGYASGPYQYMAGPGAGVNGFGPGINPLSLQNGAASAITAQGLQIEAANLQNRMNALNASAGSTMYNQYSGINQYSTGSIYQNGLQPTPGYLTGSVTIGGTIGTGSYYQPTNYNNGVGTGVIVPSGSR